MRAEDRLAAEQAMVRQTLEEIIARAEMHAHIVAAFLQQVGFRPETNTQVPAFDIDPSGKHLLLNLAAALQIHQWDSLGFRPYLPASVPTAAEAFDIVADSTSDAVTSERPETLAKTVFRTWLSECATNSLLDNMGEMLIAAQSDDQLLDAFAEFLWTNRNTLTQ